VSLNAYQRGNRDGLLSFANTLDAEAEVYASSAADYEAKLEAGPFANSVQHRNVLVQDLRLVYKIREIAKMARRAAEALPLDPENPEED
jgi:hypothetical protein